ncbi:MAG: adenine phosphoribosyltransferase [Candidatus Aminicenantes bacterium]|nr:MAG: adenine phosphoribosyltransferase [Candidatus Aminicenantes bacterium]
MFDHLQDRLKEKIAEVPDFPKPGINFKDITPLLQSAELYHQVIDVLTEWARERKPQIIVGIESRGFLFAAPLARDLRLGLAIIRKKGKLPRQTVLVKAPNEYALEYFEMHTDAIQPGEKVIIVDDLIATGSSSISAIDLVKKLGGEVVGFGAVIELSFLQGREAISQAHPDVEILTLVNYED